jgi:predicted DNA-binding transcriptional regulator YafY
MPENSRKKFLVLLRILEIFQSYKTLKIGKLISILKDDGLLNGSEQSIRRVINYYLQELQEFGYIEKRGKGRGTHWILKKSTWDRQCFLLPHQKALIILLLLTTEDIFIELLKDDIENLLIRCDFKKAFLDYIAKDIHIKYFYGIHPEHVLSILSKIVLAIENENYINLTYKKTKNFERVLPIGLGMRRGKIYLIAYEEQGEK